MAATMGMILDIGTCKTKRVSDENFSPYPLIVTPRHSGFDAGRRQNTNAQACLIAAYQDVRALTAMDMSGTITVAKAEFATNKVNEIAWGFSNFENVQTKLNTIFGNSTEKTSFKALADIKCYSLPDKGLNHCELGISSDYYPLVKSRKNCKLEINGTSLNLEPNKNRLDGYNNIISLNGTKQSNVMFFTAYDVGDTDFFNLLKGSIGKTMDFNISWE